MADPLGTPNTVFIRGLVLGLLMGLGVGVTCTVFAQQKSVSNPEPLREQENFPLISPLLTCNSGEEPFSDTAGPSRRTLQKAVTDAKQLGSANTVSIYYRNLVTGDGISINKNEQYTPASLFKVPYLMLLYRLSENDPTFLQQQLQPVPKDPSSIQYFATTSELNASSTYSVDDLATRMISDSSNQAMETLFTAVPSEKLNELYEQLRVRLPAHQNDDFVTARDYSVFFRILYNASYLNEYHSQKALELLSRSTFRKGLTARLPESIPVAHKFGERLDQRTGERQLHDCGIVYVPQRPYILCVMTKGKDFDRLANVIADISETVYKKVTEDIIVK